MSLEVGDKIPNFTAIASDGVVFDSKVILGKQPIVIYFYPKEYPSLYGTSLLFSRSIRRF